MKELLKLTKGAKLLAQFSDGNGNVIVHYLLNSFILSANGKKKVCGSKILELVIPSGSKQSE